MHYIYVILIEMAKLVWRYSDDARVIIESVYKFCMEEEESGKKLSLYRVWDRTAALTGISRSENCAREEEGTGRAAAAKATTTVYIQSVAG